MPQFVAPLTINDGSATPVAVTFSPELLSSALTVFQDRRLATRELQPTLTVGYNRPTVQRPKTYQVSHRWALPIVRNVAGVDVSNDTARVTVDFILPTSMTSQERKHLRAYVKNGLDQALLKVAIDDLDPLF